MNIIRNLNGVIASPKEAGLLNGEFDYKAQYHAYISSVVEKYKKAQYYKDDSVTDADEVELDAIKKELESHDIICDKIEYDKYNNEYYFIVW